MSKDYTMESGSSYGTYWEITAPEGVTAQEVECICNELSDWTDTPDTDELNDMLIAYNSDQSMTIDGKPVTFERLKLFQEIDIYTNTEHIETFTQSFAEV